MAESVSTATRDRILAAAVEAVRSSPVSTVTMKEIAEQVGITTPSIYKAYANRYELVADACQVVLAAQVEKIAHQVDDADDPLGALTEMLVAVFEVGRAEPYAAAYLYGIFPLQYHGHIGEAVATRVRQLTGEVRLRLRTRIDAVVAAGGLHGEPAKLVDFCLIASFGYIGESIHHDRLIKPTELAQFTIAALRTID